MDILIVEDNDYQRHFLEKYFQKSGYKVGSVSTLEAAREKVDDVSPDLIIMDWMLPDGSGLQYTQYLRGRGFNGWILMLTARTESQSIYSGLNAGADDYVSKPFRIKELEARVEVGLRRFSEIRQNKKYIGLITIGDLVIDQERSRVFSSSGALVRLTFLEYSLVLKLSLASPDLVTREEMIFDLFSDSYSESFNSLHNIIYRVRQKLKDVGVTGTEIRSMYNKGYSIGVSRY